MSLPRFDDRTWDSTVLGAREPVGVMFWAEWCLPSRTAVETAEAMAAGGQVPMRLGLLNVDENPRTSERDGIQGLPTLIVFKKGMVAEQRVGLVSKDNLVKLLEPHLG